MTYFIIKDWDENFHPINTNHKETMEEAQAIVDKVGGFFVEIEYGNVKSKYITVDPDNKTISVDHSAWDAQKIIRRFSRLREDRNIKLGDTDWTQMPDAPTAGKAVWATYRQALRDLPANTADPASPVWPTAPGD